MTDHARSALAAVIRLRTALEIVADAIRSARPDALLAAESELSAALAGVSGVRGVQPQEVDAVRAELLRARTALARCTCLGVAMTRVTDALVEAQGRPRGYDADGVATAIAAPASSIQARV